MVTVGVIGLGPDWEARFRPALRKLRERIAVRALYDPVASRAEQIAAEWNAQAVDGLTALAERADVRALLLLDAGWPGWQSVRLLSEQAKPVLIVSGFSRDQDVLRSMHNAALASGQTLMPALGLRYTPSSCRLRELMATRLGPPRSITIEAAPASDDDACAAAVPAASDDAGGAAASEQAGRLHHNETADVPFIGLVDWCRYVVRTPPLRLSAQARNGAGGISVQLEFAGAADKTVPVQVELRLPELPQEWHAATLTLPSPPGRGEGEGGASTAQIQATVACARGTARLESATRIAWQAAGESTTETLTSERNETEVMLDLFCRRVAGGLIPVPDVADVLRGTRLLEAARDSLHTGGPVELSISG